jgi:GntR family transcriptional repressor for pyruvate dehydrogenase complex
MKTTTFKSIRQNPISKQIAEQIRDLVVGGNLKQGDKLPSERELSKIIGCGRFSLREGLRILESMGILETKYGANSGTYVSKIGIEHISEKLSDFLMMSDIITIDQLTEARLETSLTNLKYFIQRATNEDLSLLEECIKETEILFKSNLHTRENNIHFHNLIAQGSKNPIFIILHKSLVHILRKFLSKFESPHDHAKKVLEGNKKILKYLRTRDFEHASAAMINHIRYVGDRLKLLTGSKPK